MSAGLIAQSLWIGLSIAAPVGRVSALMLAAFALWQWAQIVGRS